MDNRNFDDALFDAFDRMGPSTEAERRMLEALLAANEDAALRASCADEASANAFVPATAHRGGRTGAAPVAICKQGRGWKVALSAACLVLVVMAGAGAFAVFSANNAANMMVASSSTGSSSAITDTTNPSPAAPPVSEDGIDKAENAAESEASPLSTDSDARYPYVTLSSGIELRIALGDDGPLAADPALVGELVELANALSGDGETSIPCTVFATSDPAHPFAVRYEGEERYFLADEVAAR